MRYIYYIYEELILVLTNEYIISLQHTSKRIYYSHILLLGAMKARLVMLHLVRELYMRC